MHAWMPPRWPALQQHLDAALEALRNGDHQAWQAQRHALRAEQPELARELEDLLATWPVVAEAGFLERTADGQAPATEAGAAPVAPTLAGSRLGAYTLVEPIGAGGMGTVWRARRDDGRFEGDVAIKLLNLAWVGSARGERFRREGTVLARLAHPHIARLHDAGVAPGGQPYLVLEWVQGQPLDVWCSEHPQAWRERLLLLLDLADAVAVRVGHGVVHRDIKPANVMVNREGQVRLLDFGIAKLLDREETAPEAALTQRGGALLTPAWAAPEQLHGGEATTATDVYSLAKMAEQVLPADSRVRGSDLHAVLAKAQEADPTRRYAGAAELAAEWRRVLAGQPVLARPQTLASVASRFLARHRARVAGALLLLLLAAGGTLLWQQEQARTQAARAQTVEGLLRSLFAGMDPANAPAQRFTATELLDRAQAWLVRQGGDGSSTQPGLNEELHAAMAALYRDVGAFAQARTAYAQAASGAAARGDTPAQVQALWQTANLELKSNRAAAAGQALDQVAALLAQAGTARGLGAWFSGSSSHREALAPWPARTALLRAEWQLARADTAAALRELDVARAGFASFDANDAELQARWEHLRGDALRRQGDVQAALVHLQRALGWQTQRGEEAAIDRFNALVALGTAQAWSGRYALAVASLEEAAQGLHARLSSEHHLSVAASSELALAEVRRGRFAEARRWLALVAPSASTPAAAPDPWRGEFAEVVEARMQMYEGRPERAEPVFRAQRERVLAQSSTPSLASEVLRRLHAEAWLRLGDPARAEALLRQTLAAYAQMPAVRGNTVAAVQVLLATARAQQGDVAEASRLWQAAHPVLLAELGNAHPFTLVAEAQLRLAGRVLGEDVSAATATDLAHRVQAELGWQQGGTALADALAATALDRSGQSGVRWPVVF
jgi:eukaryotic-like serine/threonine-protein kinase